MATAPSEVRVRGLYCVPSCGRNENEITHLKIDCYCITRGEKMLKRVHPKTIEEKIRQILCVDDAISETLLSVNCENSSDLAKSKLKASKLTTMNPQSKFVPYNLQRNASNPNIAQQRRVQVQQQQRLVQQQQNNPANRPP